MHNMMKEAEQVRIKLTRLAGALQLGFATISQLAADRAACAHNAVCVHRPFKSANSINSDGWRHDPDHDARRETYEPRRGEFEVQLDGPVSRTKKQSPRVRAEESPSGYSIATRVTTCMYSCRRDPAPTI